MSIYVLKNYVEECLSKNIKPTFQGLNKYYKDNNMKNTKSV